MKADGIPVERPENPLPYLAEWLMEIGPLGSGGTGPVPLSWAELETWQRVTGIRLSAWEARTIRSLSRAFLDQLNKSKASTCPAPFKSSDINADAVTIQFRRMMQRSKKEG